eukprot:2443899-Ditylum_brightwellii.AAC.1
MKPLALEKCLTAAAADYCVYHGNVQDTKCWLGYQCNICDLSRVRDYFCGQDGRNRPAVFNNDDVYIEACNMLWAQILLLITGWWKWQHYILNLGHAWMMCM